MMVGFQVVSVNPHLASFCISLYQSLPKQNVVSTIGSVALTLTLMQRVVHPFSNFLEYWLNDLVFLLLLKSKNLVIGKTNQRKDAQMEAVDWLTTLY